MITKHLLPSTRQMNSINSNVGGFPASDLCEYLNGDIYNALPEDLKSLVVPIYKWYGLNGTTVSGDWYGCNVWVPLEYELFGTTNHSPATEHTTGNARKYPIFTGANSRIKKLNNGSGNANYYWEASPGAGSSAGFCAVSGIGTADNNVASASRGVCFGLCIGAPAGDFATDSWETIAAVSEAGLASQVYNLGDTKDITISGVGTMTLEIAGLNHDKTSSGQTIGISLITKDLLPQTRQMHSEEVVDGYPNSDLYDYLNGTILNGLPADLRAVMKSAKKHFYWKSSDGGTGHNQGSSIIWPPREYELFGETISSFEYEHTSGGANKYPIFTDNASRVKKLNNGNGNAVTYWTGSGRIDISAMFCDVSPSGGDSSSYCDNEEGVCFGICV